MINSMKTCRKCNIEKSLSEFASRSSMCKPCHNQYNREHYTSNKQYYIDKARKNDLKYLQIMREYIWRYLLNNPCVQCGEIDPRVLEFDHLDPSTKLFNISDAAKHTSKITVVQAEIDKCQVLCVKCHRIKTFEQFGWWTGPTAMV